MGIGDITRTVGNKVQRAVDTAKTAVDRVEVPKPSVGWVPKAVGRAGRLIGIGDDGPNGPTTTTRGAKDIPSRAHLPANASPLMRKVFEDTVGSTRHGNVPAGIYTTSGNAATAGVMIKGPEIFGGMADLIRGAKKDVALQTYDWESGSDAAKTITSGIKDLEQRRKAAGATEPVTVRILVNDLTIGKGPLKKHLQGCYDEAKKDIAALGLDPRYVKVEVAAHEHTLTGANHSKSLVVDGNRAIIGGANIQRQAGMDTAYRVDGDAALALRADIADAWKDDKGKGDTDFANLPLPSRGGARAGNTPMMVLTRPADGHMVHDWLGGVLGRDVDNPANKAYLSIFKNAKRNINVMTPNLNDDDAKKAILDAAKRGVKVNIVLPKHFNDGTESKPGQGGTNMENVKQLLAKLPPEARGNLNIKWFNGIAPGHGHDQEVAHTKYLTADGQLAIVGSSNMDTQSWNHSRETNLLVDSAATTAKWEAQVFAPAFERGIRAG